MKIRQSISSLRKQIKNKNFTLIARDCVGGVLYHELGLEFLTPTINLFFEPEDFNYFCLYLKDYINGEIKELKEEGLDYPIGMIIPKNNAQTKKVIKVHFMHYLNFDEALEKWLERKKKINYDNIYVLSTMCYVKETATINDELIAKWNEIHYPKVMISDQKYGFDDEFIIDKPKECHEYAWLLYEPDQNNPGIRVFNAFDFINFLNKK